MKIGIDGFALGLKQGTGLSTYARELAGNLGAGGHEVSILYGLNGIGREPKLRWERFMQSLGVNGESGVEDWRQWALHAGLHAVASLLRLPPDPKRLLPTATTSERRMPEGIPNAADIYNIPSLYRASQALAATTGRPLRIKRIPGIELFHLTSPLPVRMEGVPNIVTAHDVIPLVFPHSTEINLKHYRRIMEASLYRADGVFVVSEHSKRDLLALFELPEDRIHVTYQSVNIPQSFRQVDHDYLARFLKTNFRLSPGGYFLFLGAIEPKKNVMRLLDASLLARTGLPLVLAGKYGWLFEEERRRIMALTENRNTKKRVRRFDYLRRIQQMYLLKGARALVFPSLYEGFGLPVLEAMQMGVPVITSNNSSLPEVAADAAYLINPMDVHEIAHAMERLAEDDTLHESLAEKGLVRAQWFSPERHLERLQSAYRQVLAQ
jgi:glycosyltransferase involved in cell wall biosynthesis